MYRIKKILNYIKSIYYRYFKTIDTKLNKYDTYEEYVKHQLVKTQDPERVKLWLNDEWDIKCKGFLSIFNRHQKYISNCSNAICLGARTGQEVKVLRDMGIDATGIDLQEFPPFTIEGDIHDLKFEDGSFDLLFTNIVDHSLYPKIMVSEIERVLKVGGIAIIHFQVMIGVKEDNFTETKIFNEDSLKSYFKKSNLLENNTISNIHDPMDKELIFKRI